MEQCEVFLDFLDYLQTAYDVSEGPSETDLVEAINGILRAQHIYNLKSKDVGKSLRNGFLGVFRDEQLIYYSLPRALLDSKRSDGWD